MLTAPAGSLHTQTKQQLAQNRQLVQLLGSTRHLRTLQFESNLNDLDWDLLAATENAPSLLLRSLTLGTFLRTPPDEVAATVAASQPQLTSLYLSWFGSHGPSPRQAQVNTPAVVALLNRLGEAARRSDPAGSNALPDGPPLASIQSNQTLPGEATAGTSRPQEEPLANGLGNAIQVDGRIEMACVEGPPPEFFLRTVFPEALLALTDLRVLRLHKLNTPGYKDRLEPTHAGDLPIGLPEGISRLARLQELSLPHSQARPDSPSALSSARGYAHTPALATCCCVTS